MDTFGCMSNQDQCGIELTGSVKCICFKFLIKVQSLGYIFCYNSEVKCVSSAQLFLLS